MKSKVQLQTKNGVDFDVPIKGSLGLLALGYMGLYLWRSKRMSAPQKDNDQITKGYSYSKISNISENK